MNREPRVYASGDRLPVEILSGGVWRPGELRAWHPVGVDDWEAEVAWQVPGTRRYRIDKFPIGHVRITPIDDDASTGSDAGTQPQG